MLSVAVQALTMYGFQEGGIGRPQATFSDSDMVRFTVVILAIFVTFIPLVSIAKLSLIMLYYRLSPHTKLWRMCIYAIAGLIIIPTPVLTFLFIFGCQPIAKAWDPAITEGQCVDRLTIMLTSSVLNVITDFLLIITPIPLIWKLNMRIWQKLGVTLMFFLGGMNAETILVVVCDCLPSLRPFLHRHCPGGCFAGSEPSGPPTSGTRNTRLQCRGRYFDDDIELIQNGMDPSRSMVITRTVEMELQYHKNGVEIKPVKQPDP
ncbi:hypothetical protein BDV28DRAFT_157657 [Aspergillus coremiiformis]|uniref:Rhodopsin domain-containing protein n=1 Tax=Aspergillus coremiiformis TaxID=138285 RepID=A0A5N6Z4V3_9EURO|nr:hypothetical protein BDV28DRAFT_157657 [Aspergillus coremiiformis]